jgi:uncharacterized protein YoaH (UPF0181 family)
MPKAVENIVKALKRQGMATSKAYAIANTQVKNRLKVKKKAK